jgi:dolichol-phosphate mannosyltransferase
MERKKILVFAGTYNESDNIFRFITEVLKASDLVDILIVDDNSPDKTFEIIKSHPLINKKIFLNIREKKLGLDTAHKFAYNYAKNKGYEKLITMDADLSHDPKEIPRFINLLDQYEFVIGSRYIYGAKNNQPKLRYLLSYLGNKLIKIILNSGLNEHTTSYRGFNLKRIKNFDLNKIKAAGYSFFMGTIYKLKLDNVSMTEIPIIFNDRIYGQSKIPKIEILRTLYNLIKILFKKSI